MNIFELLIDNFKLYFCTGDLDSDEPELVYTARQKMATLSSCFAQLTHKAQTIFQNNAKVEVGVRKFFNVCMLLYWVNLYEIIQ